MFYVFGLSLVVMLLLQNAFKPNVSTFLYRHNWKCTNYLWGSFSPLSWRRNGVPSGKFAYSSGNAQPVLVVGWALWGTRPFLAWWTFFFKALKLGIVAPTSSVRSLITWATTIPAGSRVVRLFALISACAYKENVKCVLGCFMKKRGDRERKWCWWDDV